jgi:hypothetical protein
MEHKAGSTRLLLNSLRTNLVSFVRLTITPREKHRVRHAGSTHLRGHGKCQPSVIQSQAQLLEPM